MNIRVSSGTPSSLDAGALVVPVFDDGKLDGATEVADKELSGAIADVLSSGEIKGKTGEVSLIHAKDLKVKRVLIVGLGDRKKFEPQMLAKTAGTAVRYLGKRGLRSIAFALPIEAQHHVREAVSFIVEGAIAGTIDSTTYRSEQDKPILLETLTLVTSAGTHSYEQKALEEGVERGRILGEAVNVARLMALTPANDMTPTHMAARAEELAKEFGLGFDALDEDRMRELGMGSLLGVSRGSDEPAKLIVLTYEGDPGNSEKIALVGKGLTFDSGGISLKPADNMHEMKYDMSGGAGVIAALSAIARLKPKINVIGLVPSSENLPGPRAMKPGDVLRAMNGKTIEVINTDAEGRLILADALCYARKLGATRIIDCATLTGAMVVALGHAASGAISNDDAFVKDFLAVANRSGERYWHLPLYDEYTTAVKSEIADLRNSTGRPAGSLTAAAFLQSFVDKVPWIHLDIAGTAYVDESSSMAKGPTGTPVRALVAYVEELARSRAKGGNGAATPAGTATTAR
ncbi:MAG: leucyl aminopeptidase [Candidatus Eremiobacteraeota bacterium]|nr:leucyl aminopeptidase [Candidatus Eremiobacteraeota bacterium]